jgi:pyruvate ferredoxin oxidoreductase alpha subunit
MAKKVGIEVSFAVAEAAKLADVDVVAAYPITPQTHIVEKLADFVANGELNAESIKVESEHSAMSACVGASAAGARVFTTTSSQGIALMHEMLFIASASRLPIVMGVANRALSAPVNIWCDHSDTIAERDSGWIQIYVADGQEAFDTTVQAFKIAEDSRVLLPVMVCIDGFSLSHVIEPIIMLDKEEVQKFLPPRKVLWSLDPDKPISISPVGSPEYFSEFRRQQEEAMSQAMPVIEEVDEEYGRLFGRKYGVMPGYRVDDAEMVLVTMGTITGTARVAVDALRKEGVKVGLVQLRVYRPFPTDEVRKLAGAKVIAVCDRAFGPGALGGAVFSEFRGALYPLKTRPHVLGFVLGLGGRDVRVEDFRTIVEKAGKASETGVIERDWEFIGVRE